VPKFSSLIRSRVGESGSLFLLEIVLVGMREA